MIKKNKLDKEMKQYGLNLDEDIKFIEESIKGCKNNLTQVKCVYCAFSTSFNQDTVFKLINVFSILQWPMKGRTKDKSFLYEIVANKLNGVDVDKWDYLAR